MAENLKYLPSVVGPSTGSGTTPYYYVYDYNGTNVTDAKAKNNYKKYGVLYNGSAAKNACPSGWHLPSDDEWTQLTDYLEETNETGFNALLAGWRSNSEDFRNRSYEGVWWTNTEHETNRAWSRLLDWNSIYYRGHNDKGNGLSVRCIKN